MYEIISGIFGAFYWFFSDCVNQSRKILTSGLSMNGDTSFFDSVEGAITGFAFGLVSILFLIDLIQAMLAKGNNFGMEDIAKIMIKLLIAKNVISYSPILLDALYGSVATIINSLVADGGDIVDVQTLITEMNSGLINSDKLGDTLENIGYFIANLIPVLIIFLAGLIVYVMAWGRKIELFILISVSPLAMAWLPYQGTADITKRFVLNFLSVCLQGLILLLCLKLYVVIKTNYMSEIVSTNIPQALGEMLFACVLVMSIAMSGKWAKQIVGMG